MSQTEKRKLERVRYWQGQLLRSGDFNRIHTVEEQRRWWHNRSLHNAYGIHLDPDSPAPLNASWNADKSAVKISAGLAYDSFGRELILQTDQTIALPGISQQDQVFVLLVRYLQTLPNGRMDGLSAVCYTNSGPLRPEFVEFVWKPQDKCSFTDGVPIARLEIKNNEQTLVAIPSSSRPLARPLLASGSTVPGNTAWELWTNEVEGEDLGVLGVQTTIDTSAAGFTDAPCYFAWLQGNIFNPQTRQLVPALFTSIAEETVSSFVFRIALPMLQTIVFEAFIPSSATNDVDAVDFAMFAHKQGLYVNWVGCQKNASAPVFTAFLFPRVLLGLNLLSTIFPTIKL